MSYNPLRKRDDGSVPQHWKPGGQRQLGQRCPGGAGMLSWLTDLSGQIAAEWLPKGGFCTSVGGSEF